MIKKELDRVLVELSPTSRDSDEISMHVKIIVNDKIFQKYEFIPLDDMESVFDTIWNLTGEKLKRLIFEEIK